MSDEMLAQLNAIAPDDRVEWVSAIPRWLKLMLWLQGGRVFHFALSRMIGSGFSDSFRTLHPHRDGFTLPTPEPHARLDYIFINAWLQDRLQTCEVVRDVAAADMASDHYPVLAEFAL